MSLRQIDNSYFVSAQVTPDMMGELSGSGFSAIVCMRPDGEVFGQRGFKDIEAAAHATGLRALYLPVKPGSAPLDQASKLKAFLQRQEGKVLGYCASGNRATMLYQLARQAAA